MEYGQDDNTHIVLDKEHFVTESGASARDGLCDALEDTAVGPGRLR